MHSIPSEVVSYNGITYGQFYLVLHFRKVNSNWMLGRNFHSETNYLERWQAPLSWICSNRDWTTTCQWWFKLNPDIEQSISLNGLSSNCIIFTLFFVMVQLLCLKIHIHCLLQNCKFVIKFVLIMLYNMCSELKINHGNVIHGERDTQRLRESDHF